MKEKELIPVTHRVCRRPDGSIYGISKDKRCRKGSEDYTTTFRIKRLNDQREELAKKLISYMSQTRPDGVGNFMEHPDEKSLKIVDAVGAKVSEIDRKINSLEGKDPRERRWVEGDPYGLKKYSNFTSVARRNYENEVKREVLSSGVKGNKAVLVIGGPASGKVKVSNDRLRSMKGFISLDQGVIKSLDPVTRVGQALGVKDASALAHGNARRLTREIYEEAKNKGINMVIKGTGSKADRYVGEIQNLKGLGYRVSVIASHVPPGEGITRAVAMSEKSGVFHPLHHIRKLHFTLPADLERISREADNAIMFDGTRSKSLMSFQSGSLTGPVTEAIQEFRNTYNIQDKSPVTSPPLTLNTST